MSRRRRQIIPTPGRPATWADLESLPEDITGEIVNGEIVVKPRPDLPHTRTASDLGIVLGGPFRMGIGGPGGWLILFEPRVRFGEDIRVPDMAGWRKERCANLPTRGPISVVPDWICEVLSRSTEAEDRTVKLALYARARVPHVWLVNPHAHTLEVYRLEGTGWHLAGTYAEDQRVRAEPFDAVEIELAKIWGEPEAEEPED